MISFKKTPAKPLLLGQNLDCTSIEYSFEDDVTLDELLDAFKYFLSGCGYYIEGKIGEIDEEDLI